MAQFPEVAFWLALAYASPLNLSRAKDVIAAWCLEAGQPLAALLELTPADITERLPLDLAEAEQIVEIAGRIPEQTMWLERLEGAGMQLIIRTDPRYPKALVRWFPMAMQPLLLYCRGDVSMLGRPSVAVIGAQGTGEETISLARELVALLAEEGLVVVSGLARGVGQAAFDTTLATEGGQTVAVLPMGLNAFLSRSDASGEVTSAAEQGQALLLSPFHPDAKFSETQAIARNKLMVALTEAVFVVAVGAEGAVRKTADEALRQGKTVYVWDAEPSLEPAAAGNQALIEAGALPIAGAPDILDAVEAVVATALERVEDMEPPVTAPPPPQVMETEVPYDSQAVLDLLSKAGRVPDALARRLREESEEQ